VSRGREGRGGRRTPPAQTTANAVASALYESYGARVQQLCARRLGADEAPDAVQDTFLRAWLALRDGAEIRHQLPWLLTIADNVCVSRVRARRARVVTTELPESAGVEPSASSGELEGLTTAFRGLPDAQRHALLRRELQGLSYDEIGAELGVSRASVAALLHRARRAVSESLHTARRGHLAFAPISVVFRVIHTGEAAGVAAAGSTAAVAVTVAQLAGPAPTAAPEPSQSQAVRIEVVAIPRSIAHATGAVRLGGAREIANRVATPSTQRRKPDQPAEASSKSEPEVLVWQPPFPRAHPNVPISPSEETPATDTTPVSPQTAPAADEPGPAADAPGAGPDVVPAANEADEADTGDGDRSEGDGSETALWHGGSEGQSDSAGGGGEPPGLAGSGPPGGESAGHGNGQGGSGQAGSGQAGVSLPAPQVGYGRANGQPSPAGDGPPSGGSLPSAGPQAGGHPAKGDEAGT
jgi:RNA polymerase sigma factor (sigma-70 family)